MQPSSEFSPITMFRPIPDRSICADTISIELSSSGYSRPSVPSSENANQQNRQISQAKNSLIQRKPNRLSDSSSVSIRFDAASHGEQPQAKRSLGNLQIFKEDDNMLDNQSNSSFQKDKSIFQPYAFSNTTKNRQRVSEGSSNSMIGQNILGSLADQNSRKSLLNKQSFGQSSIYEQQASKTISSSCHQYQTMLTTMQATQLKTKQSQQTHDSYNNTQYNHQSGNISQSQSVKQSCQFSTFEQDRIEQTIEHNRNIHIAKFVVYFLLSVFCELGLYAVLTLATPLPIQVLDKYNDVAIVSTFMGIIVLTVLNQCWLTRKNEDVFKQLNLVMEVRKIRRKRRKCTLVQIVTLSSIAYILSYF